MKNLFPYLFLLCSVLLLAACKKLHPVKVKAQPSFGFTADSGYILTDKAIAILRNAKYESFVQKGHRDTIDLHPSDIKPTDTIGKFYKLKNGHYLTCIEDIIRPDRFNNKVLSELDEKGNVLQSEGYYSGNYFCCWNNRYEGFEKHGDYFSINTCGTGSCFCAAYIHLFKEIEPQVHGISRRIWACGGTNASDLTSQLQIRNDTVIMHYTFEQLEEDENENYKVFKKEKFDIKYVKREQEWIALDSTNISKFPS